MRRRGGERLQSSKPLGRAAGRAAVDGSDTASRSELIPTSVATKAWTDGALAAPTALPAARPLQDELSEPRVPRADVQRVRQRRQLWCQPDADKASLTCSSTIFEPPQHRRR